MDISCSFLQICQNSCRFFKHEVEKNYVINNSVHFQKKTMEKNLFFSYLEADDEINVLRSRPMLILLLLGAPSVPRETQTPESSISLIGANPNIRMADAGQWETLTPAFEKCPICISEWHKVKPLWKHILEAVFEFSIEKSSAWRTIYLWQNKHSLIAVLVKSWCLTH